MSNTSEAAVSTVTSPAPAPGRARTPPRGPRYKVRLALLASLCGWFGAHWWYVGRKGAWAVTAYAVICLAMTARFPVWHDNPAFFLLFIPMTDGMIEGVIFCLINDEKFDRIYNPGLAHRTRMGWGVISVAIFNTLLAAGATMFALAMVVVYVWKALGWFNGYVL